MKTFIDIPGYTVEFKPESASSNAVTEVQPNMRGRMGLEISYGWIGIGGGFKLQQLDKDKTLKGETDYQDWRFSFNWNSWRFNLNYSQYQGMFINNSDEVDPTWNDGDNFLQKPDFRSEQSSLNITYVLDPSDFSIRAALDQTERQTKSGGSWIFGGGFVQTRLSDDSGLIPTIIQSHYGTDQSITSAQFSGLNLKVGYGHLLVLDKSWFTSLALMLGAGLEERKYVTDSGETKKIDSNQKSEIFLSLGYNGDSYFSGFSAYLDHVVHKTESIRIAPTLWVGTLFFGRRF